MSGSTRLGTTQAPSRRAHSLVGTVVPCHPFCGKSGRGTMIVDRAWVERNIGFDPLQTPAPISTYAFRPAARPAADLNDIQRDIIEFDSEGPEGAAFFAFTSATGLSRFTEIPWPSGLAPVTGSKPAGDGTGPLPRSDVLVVTWTVDEGHALSRVLTPGKDSKTDYASYTHNFAPIAQNMYR